MDYVQFPAPKRPPGQAAPRINLGEGQGTGAEAVAAPRVVQLKKPVPEVRNGKGQRGIVELGRLDARLTPCAFQMVP